ncbi:hypothetical protein cce_0977 [Crocosphaera subtropica ATCC 51142]|uniref:Uncharacterized protein n=1 Tax=Crocosphaera subtropica (strain ATCC 51142 / BH68) TaxID=43989 RepID=B1WSZ8_CROS5|nr:hypothetical protein cce_0977 [Crocosphaera subtropica ATCC 51142]
MFPSASIFGVIISIIFYHDYLSRWLLQQFQSN